MKKYKVNYLRRFTANNGKNYCALEITSVESSKDKVSGAYLGHRTYSVLTKSEKIPADVLPDDYIKCSISFDKKTGKPFAYDFSKCDFGESIEAINKDFIDSVEGTVFTGGAQ